MELQQVEAEFPRTFVDERARFIDEHAHDLGSMSDNLPNRTRTGALEIARARLIKVQSDQVRAGQDGGLGIFDAGHAAYFDPYRHRESPPDRASSKAASFARGSPPRSRLSPIKNPRAPARSSRTMSWGVSIPLSEIINASLCCRESRRSVTARSVTKL